MQFELTLAGTEALSTRRMTTLHLMLAFVLCGLGAGCLVLYWYTAVSPKFKEAYAPFAVFGICSLLAGILITAVSVFYKNWLMKGKRNMLLRFVEIGILGGAAILFLLADQQIPASIFGIVAAMISVAAIWESRGPGPLTVTISEKGIELPKGGTLRLISWSEIEGVLLRHSILSIELTRNRLIQRSVSDTAANAEALEAFSANLIRQYEKERAANADW